MISEVGVVTSTDIGTSVDVELSSTVKGCPLSGTSVEISVVGTGGVSENHPHLQEHNHTSTARISPL